MGQGSGVAEFTKSGNGRIGHLRTGVRKEQGSQKRWITGCKSRDCVQQSATRPLGLTTTYFELGSAALSQKAAARITGS